MMKMTEKTKRRLAVGGGIAICAGLLAAISLQFAEPPAGEDELPGKESSAAELIIDPSHAADGSDAASSMEESSPGEGNVELSIQPDTGQGAGETQTAQPVDSRPAQTGQPEQSIQPEVEKPQQPDGENLTNPEEKPDGTPVEATPEPVDHDTYVPPADDGGAGSGGGMPGFGSVPNGGANAETQAGDMYENGNKIGSMD